MEEITLHGHSYRLLNTVAVQWCPEMAKQFPNADHGGCRQELWHNGEHWERFTPPRCHGYHCPECGEATGSYGHRACT